MSAFQNGVSKARAEIQNMLTKNGWPQGGFDFRSKGIPSNTETYQAGWDAAKEGKPRNSGSGSEFLEEYDECMKAKKKGLFPTGTAWSK